MTAEDLSLSKVLGSEDAVFTVYIKSAYFGTTSIGMYERNAQHFSLTLSFKRTLLVLPEQFQSPCEGTLKLCWLADGGHWSFLFSLNSFSCAALWTMFFLSFDVPTQCLQAMICNTF